MDCSVCCEKMRTPVLCECGFNVCRNCVRTYLAGQVSEPHCMNCKLAWNLEFLENAIGKTYLKTDYKKQRAAVFVEFEKTQLPDMQEEARIYEITERLNAEITHLKKENEQYKDGTYGCNWCIGNKFKLFIGCNACKNATEEIPKVQMENIRIMNLTRQPDLIEDKIERYDRNYYNTYHYRYCNNYRFKCVHCSFKFNWNILYKILTQQEYDEYIKCEVCSNSTCFKCFGDYSHQNHQCQPVECLCDTYMCDTCIVEKNDRKIHALKEQIRIINNKEGQPKERKAFIMKCQIDGCEGFLSQQYKCGLCSKYTCSNCYMPKEENHECNPDNVASTKMIKEETRPCPKCSTRIYKIDGCDQMWCTDCKTAFSWRTGNIVNGTIHNPHYYEYLRNTQGSVPRADQPYNPCAEIMDRHQIRAFQHRLIPFNKKNSKFVVWVSYHIESIHRYFGEISDTAETVQAELNDINGDRYIRQLRHNRILYLLKRIDKTRFEHDAFMFHQRSVQFRRFVELIQMMKQVVLDIFNNMYTNVDVELKKEKEANKEEIVKIIKDSYQELFGVIRYFRSQHTHNPYTKIATDRYDTRFITKSTNGGTKGVTFLIPSQLEDNEFMQLYDLSFSSFTENERAGKIKNQAAAVDHDYDY